jgi:lysophospholipase L1-like esterase
MKQLKIALGELLLGKMRAAVRDQIADATVAGAGGVAFFGDSISHFAKWDLLFPGVASRNLGIGGDRTTHLLERLDPVVALKPEKLFLLIGANDLNLGFTVEETAANLDTLVARLRERLPACRIYLQGVMPAKRKLAPPIRALNERYRQIAGRHGVPFIDLFPVFDDGTGQLRAEYTYDVLHLSGAGYIAWRDTIAPFVAER